MERKFMDYLRKYCIKHNISVAEALRHKVVKEVLLKYAEEEMEKRCGNV